MLSLFLLSICFLTAEGLPYFLLPPLKQCPNIPAQDNIHVDQIVGSWRMSYLFHDDKEKIEEDNSCVVVEFKSVSETTMNIAIFVDVPDNEFLVDRSTLDLTATFLSPGEWTLHAGMIDESAVHVTVIWLTKRHMVLVICIFDDETSEDKYKEFGHSLFLEELRSDKKRRFFRKNKFDSDSTNVDLNAIFDRTRYFRRKRSSMDIDGNRQSLFQEKKEKKTGNNKHFWTIILTKDNNVSPLSFVENASMLMKFGFDLREGNLLSLAKCGT